MKIALYGAKGNVGRVILREALARGHQVTAVVRNAASFKESEESLSVKSGDATAPSSVAEAVRGHDVVISAIGPKLPKGDPQVVVETARALLEGVERAGVKRLVVVGGAGSLEVTDGIQVLDTPDFPAAWKPVALAHRDALEIFRIAQTNLDWTYISPAAMIQPGERTGKYRIGGDQLLLDEKGESRISIEDYAAALLDEVENSLHTRQRITAAY